MIHALETKLIPVSAIEMGLRDRLPTEAEVDQMVSSIEQDGLLTAIGVQTTADSYRLLYGATRLLAVQKLDWSELSAVLYEGTEEELASAEIIENLERRHLDKDERAQLTRMLVERRAKAVQSEPREELCDKLSCNSSQEPKAHPKTKVEGARRGRPVTAEGNAKKEVAAKTGQSVRNVQRATSTKPKQTLEPARPRSAVASKDEAQFDFTARVLDLLRRIGRFQPEHFAGTKVAPDDLAKVGKFLSDLATLKAGASKPTPTPRSEGNGTVSPEQSAEEMKAKFAALDEADDRAG